MPELPEVETVRAGLAAIVTGRRIERVTVLHPRPVRRHVLGPEDFAATLEVVERVSDALAPALVELAAGLETQFQRCDDGRVRWLCVDVPEALQIREQFLPAAERCRHIPCSALDLRWLDQVEPGPVFVTAQGLFMYFTPGDVQMLVTAVVERLPGVEIMFDTIPPWFSRKTLHGFAKTANYTAPPMPWGVRRDDIDALLRGWSPRIASVRVRSYGRPYGLAGKLLPVLERVPVLRNVPPAIVHVRT